MEYGHTLADDASAARPIFLLGVGRCASTFQQSQLCNADDVWIWGEHNGILSKLLAWGDGVRADSNLNRLSFAGDNSPEAIMGGPLGGNATPAAWLNGFRPTDIDQVERLAIAKLFSIGLPPGKTRWGFKEIRYGLNDDVPERLLALFPGAKIVHTLRDPMKTAESAIVTWGYQRFTQIVETDDDDRLDAVYQKQLKRWKAGTDYYLDLEERYPDRVITSRIETFRSEFGRILDFLEIEREPDDGNDDGGVVNRGRRRSLEPGSKAAQMLAERRARFAGIVADTAQRAGYELRALASA